MKVSNIVAPSDIHGATETAARWYKNPAILLPCGLLFVYVILYVLPLGYRPLIIPDEARYAEIPREMLATGDWITPHLNGLRYFEKPPLGYWLNAISIAVFGENELAARLPGALAAGATTLLVFLFVFSVWRNRRTALAAALIHMTCLEVYLVGTFNVLDNFVTLFLTAGIYTFYLAAGRAQRMSTSWSLWAISGISFGLAFLTKGFLAFAIPVLVLVPWMVWRGQWRLLIRKGWWVVFASVLVALPWAVMIHLHEGDFWRYFFWVEHIKRFTAENAQHKAPVYYYLMYLLPLAFPWLTLAPAAISGLRAMPVENLKERFSLRLLWLWLLLPVLFFSVSSGKQATYILPCFPPFAILTAIGLAAYLKKQYYKLFDFGLLSNALIFLFLFTGLLIIQTVDIGFRVFDENETVKFIAVTLSLLLGASAGLTAIVVTRLETKLVASLVMIIPVLFVVPFVMPNKTLERKSPGQQLMQYRDQVNEDTVLISDATMMHAVAWYLKRDDIYLISMGEVEYGLSYPDAKHRFLDEARFRFLMEKEASTRSILMVCKNACPAQLTTSLPQTARKSSRGTFTFWFVPSPGTSKLNPGALS